MNAAQWDAMTVEQRRKVARGLDTSMKRPEWKALVERMAASSWAELSGLQRAALATK